MPNGNVHSAATVLLAVSAGYLMYHNGLPFTQTLAVSGGTLAGLLLTPDLDVNQGCVSDQIMRRSAGRAAGGLWYIFWLPYSRLIPHRSPLSHFPVLGTTIRLAYVFALPLLLYALAQGTLSLPMLPAWAIWSAGGLALADLLHYLLDKIF
jgi:uncharacterized metal-binding protein